MDVFILNLSSIEIFEFAITPLVDFLHKAINSGLSAFKFNLCSRKHSDISKVFLKIRAGFVEIFVGLVEHSIIRIW